jgi:hypothetical protein
MKRLLAAAFLTLLIAATFASAQEAPPISAAQFQKMQKFLDTIGSKETFSAPAAQNLGLSNDVAQDLPVVVIRTNDRTVYFCRSELNPADFIVWFRVPDNASSYMFATHADFKLMRALYLHTDAFPLPADIESSQVLAAYKKALLALAKDIDSSHSP